MQALHSIGIVEQVVMNKTPFDVYLINVFYRSIFPLTEIPEYPYYAPYRTSDAMSCGGRSKYIPHQHLDQHMKTFCDNLNWQIENDCHLENFWLWLADLHHTFETIHPFPDGNGRTGRLIIVYFCLRFGYKIPQFTNRDKYLTCLENNDKNALAQYLKGK